MLLHLGADYSVFTRDVVAICDLNTAQAAAYINHARSAGRCITIGAGDRSLVICKSPAGDTAYLSPIAPRTLAARFGRVGSGQ